MFETRRGMTSDIVQSCMLHVMLYYNSHLVSYESLNNQIQIE